MINSAPEFYKEVILLYKSGRVQDAINTARIALSLFKGDTQIIALLQKVGESTGNINIIIEAAQYYGAKQQKAIAAMESALFADQIYCDWLNRDFLIRHLTDSYKTELAHREMNMSLLATIDDPAKHIELAKCITNSVLNKSAPFLSKLKQDGRRNLIQGNKIRVGYVSCDFACHPMARVIADVLENHDRERFEIIGYDYSPEDGSVERERIKNAFEGWRLIDKLDFVACADTILLDQIDVLVDLKGYTRDACPEIFSLRPAPIQVSFLGFPASLAAPWIDYVIADRHVIPPEERSHWCEALAFMPNSYYPITLRDSVDDGCYPLDKINYGIPEDAFVFGCFNNPIKITPDMFQLWMKILEEVPDSVLWLYNRMPVSQKNLRARADAFGINPARLVFAEYQTHEKHLNRYSCMDLFLDTNPYNAHTTATDALSLGVPVLTLPGQSFASRVGLSLLSAFGVSDLIAKDPEDYITKAIELATRPKKLRELRSYLKEAKQSRSVLNPSTFTRQLESLFTCMVERHRQGLQRCDITNMSI